MSEKLSTQSPAVEPPSEALLKKLYEDLTGIGQMDISAGAKCREQAQQVLANPEISLKWQNAIAERLHDANHSLGIKTVTGDDSY